MGTKLKNLTHNLLIKSLLVAIILTCSVLFIEQLYGYAMDQSWTNHSRFEDTQTFTEQYERLLDDVGRSLGANRNFVGFNADKLSTSLKGINTYLPSFTYRLENPNGDPIGESLPIESFFMAETSIFIGRSGVTWPQRVQQGNDEYFNGRFDAQVLNITRILPQDWKLYVSISPVDDSGKLGKDYLLFQSATSNETRQLMMMALFGGIAGLCFLWLTVVSGRAYLDAPIALNRLDRLPLEVLITIPFLTLAALIAILQSTEPHLIVIQTALTTALAVTLAVFFSLVRRIKGRQLLRTSFMVQGVWGIFWLLSPSRWQMVFKPILLPYMVLFGLSNLILGLTLPYFGIVGLLLWLALMIGTIYWCHKELKALLHLKGYVNQQVNGQLDVAQDPNAITPMMKDFADDLSKLHEGLHIAVADALKNERMRTELIANVTHDLKNPLTSIISYVDLLSKENLDNSTAKGYVHILQDKSQRLKILIDHLVEASKLSSGMIEAQFKSLDLIAFINQLEGEYADDFAKRNLQWRLQVTPPIEPVVVDDHMLLRILENLLSNIVKYAMPGTRVYLDVSAGPGGTVLSLKNISEHPIAITAEELMERFVRADSARSSEGNGLGLSIAQSLAGVINSRLTISVDGDMFKATLNFSS